MNLHLLIVRLHADKEEVEKFWIFNEYRSVIRLIKKRPKMASKCHRAILFLLSSSYKKC